MKILLVGSGAREHALTRALLRDPAVSGIVAVPGNPGARAEERVLAPDLGVDILDGAAIAALATAHGVDLAVIGPEAPLVAGVADALRAVDVPVFGPSAAAARLEGSKAFAKEIMAMADVPTAMAYVCTTEGQVADALDAFGPPYVVKDDGLAAGKGVVVTEDRQEALAHARACLAKGVGGDVTDGAAAVVIEEFLDGPEVSLFCLADGERVVPLEPAQDFKRCGDGDTGPNTGGMGAYSPLPWAPQGMVEDVVARVAQPVIDEMARQGIPFVGLLYCGLALTSRGMRVVEFNARFGDPETQVVLARLRSPLGQALHAAATGRLDTLAPLEWSDGAAVTVVLAAQGYPGRIRTGVRIEGLTEAAAVEGAHVLHAGTADAPDAPGGAPGAAPGVVSSGGRVLCVVGEGESIAQAREVAYDAMARISLPGAHHRTDIAATA